MKRIINPVFVSIILAALLGVPQGSTNAIATEYFVSPTGDGTTCTESAPCSLQTAASLITELSYVYLEEGNYEVDSGDEVAKFTESAWLIGSCIFDGDNATPPDCGHIGSNRSLIDGEYERRGLVLTGTETERQSFYIMHVDFDRGYGYNIDTSRCATTWGTPGGCGAGIFIEYAHQVTLVDLNIGRGIAGGYEEGLVGYGGGVYVQNSSNILISECTFFNNGGSGAYQGFGAGVYAMDIDSKIEIKDSIFDRNICCSGINCLGSRGCGVMVYASNDVLMSGNTFIRNNISIEGVIKGSAIYVDQNHQFDINHNTFTENRGDSCLEANNSTNVAMDVIDANEFVGDYSYNLIQYEGRYWVKITNNMLIHHDSSARGGPSYIAIKLNSSLVNNIPSIANIYHNSISVADFGMDLSDNLWVYIKNNIVAFTGIWGISPPGSPTNFIGQYQTNLFYSNVGNGTGIDDPSSINAHPGFIDMLTDLHITCSSPAVDKATANQGVLFDFDGQVRPNGGYDIGADEACGFYFMPFIHR